MAPLTTADRTRMSVAAIAAGAAVAAVALFVPEASVALAKRPWSPFYAQEPGQAAWLALAAAVLACGLWTAVHARGRTGALRAGAFVLAFTAAMAARASIIPFVILGALAIARAPLPLPAWARRGPKVLVPLVAIALLALTIAGAARRPRTLPAPPLEPPQQVRHWIDRGNPWRARHSARIWAAGEARDPGAGHLALAELDRTMGRSDRAAQVLARVVAASSNPELRAEAKRRLDDMGARP